VAVATGMGVVVAAGVVAAGVVVVDSGADIGAALDSGMLIGC
jgi:hypothetical protein